ncbi:MAG: FecR domain-containing protein [Bacteroidota bacterium]
MFEEKDDTIMARWLAGELNEAELAEFEASSEYVEYQRLVNGLEAFEKTEFNKEVLRERLWQSLADNPPSKTKVIPLKSLVYLAGAAASVLLLLGLFFNEVTYSTDSGEKETVRLPDGTEVFLNAKSTLTRNRFFWSSNKKVAFSGEGFFVVTKGAGFQVETVSGLVRVLGTQFNIRSRDENFELLCHEGKVSYENAIEEQQLYLTAGEGLRLQGNIVLEFNHRENEPHWQQGISQFSNAPLTTVMKELEAQYGVQFKYAPGAVDGHFTGTFVHNAIELALRAVFVPMGIDYELSEDKKTVHLHGR